MSKKYNLLDYKFAKEVSEDFPIIMDLIEALSMKLLPYRKYVTVRALLEDLNIKNQQFETNIRYSADVIIKKGSRDV